MPRKKHEWCAGAKLHITARGNHRNSIFREEKDYELYLHYLIEAIKYYENKYKLIAYVLMTNHVHIMIETTDKDVSDLIKRAHGRYACNFNKKYNYIGHLFQDRYRGILIRDCNYLLEVSRYVHLNPVRAGIVERPEQYKWSSYNMFIGKKEEKLVNADIVLEYFENDCSLYKEFVEAKMGSDPCKIIPGV